MSIVPTTTSPLAAAWAGRAGDDVRAHVGGWQLDVVGRHVGHFDLGVELGDRGDQAEGLLVGGCGDGDPHLVRARHPNRLGDEVALAGAGDRAEHDAALTAVEIEEVVLGLLGDRGGLVDDRLVVVHAAWVSSMSSGAGGGAAGVCVQGAVRGSFWR